MRKLIRSYLTRSGRFKTLKNRTRGDLLRLEVPTQVMYTFRRGIYCIQFLKHGDVVTRGTILNDHLKHNTANVATFGCYIVSSGCNVVRTFKHVFR